MFFDCELIVLFLFVKDSILEYVDLEFFIFVE